MSGGLWKGIIEGLHGSATEVDQVSVRARVRNWCGGPHERLVLPDRPENLVVLLLEDQIAASITRLYDCVCAGATGGSA